MKKRIFAFISAFFVAFSVCMCNITIIASAAAGAVGAILTIGVLAFNLLGVMTGQYDDTAEAIGLFIENGVEGWQKAFVGSENTPSWFVSGWDQIYNTCSGWFEDGSISIDDDGIVRMKYSQYLELCNMVGSAYADFSVYLGTDIPYICFNVNSGSMYFIEDSIMVSSISDLADGISYSPIYYTDDKIYFSGTYFQFLLRPWTDTDDHAFASCSFYCYDLLTFKSLSSQQCMNGYYGNVVYSDFLNKEYANFYIGTTYDEFYHSFRNFNWSSDNQTKSLPNLWYSFDGVNLVQEDPDRSAASAIINCRGPYLDFIQDIKDYTLSSSAAHVDDLTDPLADILLIDSDPTLDISTDPSISIPSDAITVSDVPGVVDTSLTDLINNSNIKTDIDIPSVIIDKFPFCLPFDLYRIFTILVADPIPPVIRIPLSNVNNDYIDDFSGNQTLGDILDNSDSPMFIIDEEIVLDLSVIPFVQPLCYTVCIVGFVFMLILITPKLIQH